jgi:hypothetical protein
MVDLVEQREIRIDRRVHDRVHDALGTALQQLGMPHHAIGDVGERRRLAVVHRDEKVGAEEERDVERLEVVGIVSRGGELDTTHDREEEARILVHLDAAERIEGILDRQRVEGEDVVEHADALAAGDTHVHPELALAGLDDVRELGNGEIATQPAIRVHKQNRRSRWVRRRLGGLCHASKLASSARARICATLVRATCSGA